MKRTVLVCGLIAGIVVSSVMAIGMITSHNNPNASMETNMIIGYLSMLIAFSMIFVGVKNFRDKQNNGVISFGKAFRIGLYITLIASSIYVLVWFIEYHLFIPDFMDKYAAHMLQQAKATATPAELQQKTAEMEQYKQMYKNPLFVILFTYMEILPVGLFVSLLSAAILWRRNKRQVVAAA